MANVKSKTAPESYRCQCPCGSDIRKQVRRDVIRMSEPGHWNMIALTDGLRKGSFVAYCAPDPGELSHSRRHGIVSEIIIRPFFRQPPAALDCEKNILRWPGSFGFGFLSPQPPGIVGTGPSAANKRANVSWPFLFERMSFERVAYAERRRRESTTARFACRDPNQS